VVVIFQELGASYALAGITVDACSPLLSIFSSTHSDKSILKQSSNSIKMRTANAQVEMWGRHFILNQVSLPSSNIVGRGRANY